MTPLHAILLLCITLNLSVSQVQACSVLYYVDSTSGNVFVVNNEDYWYDVKAYIKIEPKTNTEYARLWYGWDNFAQGGVNEFGLFFDGAVTPNQSAIHGYGSPDGNLGDKILANCQNVEEALDYIEEKKIALTNSHMMFGDSSGQAVVVEWVKGSKVIRQINRNRLIMTNYLLADTSAGNYPCYRYESINKNIDELESKEQEIGLLQIGNTFNRAAQIPRADENGRIGGTLYTTFINLSDMQFILSYKLSNTNVVKLNLIDAFTKNKKQKIVLKEH